MVHRDVPPPGWDAYVARHPQASAYHASAWPRAVASLFELESYFLAAVGTDGELSGVLPLVRQRSVLFGDRLPLVAWIGIALIVAAGIIAVQAQPRERDATPQVVND